MKNLSFLFCMALLLLLGACSTPGDYNVAIMDETIKVEKSAINVVKLLKDENLDAAQTALQESRDIAKAALEKLERMSAFRDDDLLRQSAINFVAFYDRLFTNEYQEAYDLLKMGITYTEDRANVIDDIYKLEIELKQQLMNEHIAFIKKYGLIAVERD